MCAHISIHTYCVYICVRVYIYKYCIYIRFSLLHLVHDFFFPLVNSTKMIFQIHVCASSGSSL